MRHLSIILALLLTTSAALAEGQIINKTSEYICTICKDKGKKRVAIYTLTNDKNEETADTKNSTTILISKIIECGDVKVIDPSKLEKVLQEQAKGLTGVIEESTAPQTGKMVGAQVLIFGQFSGKVIQIRLVDAETGEVIGATVNKGTADEAPVIQKEVVKKEDVNRAFQKRRMRRILKHLGRKKPGAFLLVTANDEELTVMKKKNPRAVNRLMTNVRRAGKVKRFKKTRKFILAMRKENPRFDKRIRMHRDEIISKHKGKKPRKGRRPLRRR